MDQRKLQHDRTRGQVRDARSGSVGARQDRVGSSRRDKAVEAWGDARDTAGPAGRERTPSVYSEACPSRAVLSLIADKWTLLILPALRKGPCRNGELMRTIEGVSQKMLTQTLRELERNGLVVRQDYLEIPPRVEYQLTDLGRSLAAEMRRLDCWAENNLKSVLAARRHFETRAGVGKTGAAKKE